MTNSYNRQLLKISIPVTLVQFSASLLLVTDTFVVTMLAPEALAVLGGGNGIFLFSQFVMVAAMFAVDGFVAQAVAQNDRSVLRSVLGSATFYALALGGLCVLTSLALLVLWQDSDKRLIAEYIFVMSLSLPFYLAFLVFQKFWNTNGASRQMFQINLVGLVVNAVADVVLIKTIVTQPESALAIAVATVILRIAVLGMAFWYSARRLGIAQAVAWFSPVPHLPSLARITRLGLSTGINGVVDSATFLLLSLGAIHFGTQAMEISQYAITLGLVLFPLYIGIGNASTILVGGAVGQKLPEEARNIARQSLRLASLFAVVPAGIILLVSVVIYGQGQYELALVLACVAAYQWADAIQAVGSSILRASNIGTPQVVANILAFYGVGPIVLLLCFWVGLEFLSIWITFSSAVIATGLFHYVLYLRWSQRWIVQTEVENAA